MLYVLAAWTGLRRGELGSLTRQSFKLDVKPMMQDLKAARAIWIDKAKNENERKQRESSDFLKYQDS